jgi:uncharacterized membrane protein
MSPYYWHPIAVHFPIALLLAGSVFAIWSWGSGPAGNPAAVSSRSWVDRASVWLLWIGTLAAAVSVGTGLLAQDTVPQVPQAWQIMEMHKRGAFCVLGLSLALSLWRLWKRPPLPAEPAFLYLFGWLLLSGLLVATGLLGGRLVYEFGVAVKTAPHL